MNMAFQFKEVDRTFRLHFSSASHEPSLRFNESIVVQHIVEGEYYTGDYSVTPKVQGQTLPTANKLMAKDVSVLAIPYFDVSNPSGGQTIYIGNEV